MEPLVTSQFTKGEPVMKSFLVLLLLSVVGLFDCKPALAASSESFRQSCRIRYETWDRVQADCRTISGHYIYNDFDKRGCVGDIANIDGNIQCERRQHRPSIPRGSYLQSCNSCSADRYVLSCQCLDRRGNTQYTSLYDYDYCRGDIANINGNLTCN